MENAIPTVPASSFGFAVQKNRCEARAPDVWLPLLPEDEEDGDTGLQLVRHYEPIVNRRRTGGGMKLIRRIANAIIGRKLVSKLWWR